MKIAHFYDLDSLLIINNKIWIVDKTNPKLPLIRIGQSDFNLIKSGVFRNQGNNINFADDSYWIPTALMNDIKIKCKNNKIDISKLAFSMQEFMNTEIIDNLEYDINLENILHLKNTNDHIYIICSKNSKRSYDSIIKKIENKLKDNGLVIKDYYFISETFYNRNEDNISHKKVRLLLQHLIGLKTEGDKFINEEIDKYDELSFYDDERGAINLAMDANNFLQILLKDTEDSIKSNIKDDLKSREPILFVNNVTHNRVNKFITSKVIITWSNIIKSFESFKYKS